MTGKYVILWAKTRSMEQTFEAKMSGWVKFSTIIFHLILIPVPLILMINGQFKEWHLWPGVFYCSIIVFLFLVRPFKYVLSDHQLVIHKYILPKKIKLSEIETVGAIDYADLRVRLRLFGSGGIWGWFGYFWAQGGVVNVQCTERNNMVMIVTKKKKKIILSPSETDIFLAEMAKQMNIVEKYAAADLSAAH